jgi:hypothetical protein
MLFCARALWQVSIRCISPLAAAGAAKTAFIGFVGFTAVFARGAREPVDQQEDICVRVGRRAAPLLPPGCRVQPGHGRGMAAACKLWSC